MDNESTVDNQPAKSHESDKSEIIIFNKSTISNKNDMGQTIYKQLNVGISRMSTRFDTKTEYFLRNSFLRSDGRKLKRKNAERGAADLEESF
jgi:hypothetical protein